MGGMDVATFLRDLGLKDAAKVTGVLDDLGITSGSEWLLLSDDDLSEALDELKDAKVALGDRNKLRNAKKIVQQQVCRKTEHDAMRLSASLPHKTTALCRCGTHPTRVRTSDAGNSSQSHRRRAAKPISRRESGSESVGGDA